MVRTCKPWAAVMILITIASLYGGSLTKYLKKINNATVNVVDEVMLPYRKVGVSTSASTSLHLELYHEESNDIIDEEEWYDQYNIPFPETIDRQGASFPRSTQYGNLIFLRVHNKRYYAVYGTALMLEEPMDIYDEGHRYTLIMIDTITDTVKAYSLDALFPDILEMCWFDAVDDHVYFNAAYNGYAEIRGNNTGYLYCLDVEKGDIVWATRNLISSYRGFTLHRDHILTGYGFTAEPDFLYVVDRVNGNIEQTIPIKTAHEHIAIKHDKCYVRTYNMNYIYTILE